MRRSWWLAEAPRTGYVCQRTGRFDRQKLEPLANAHHNSPLARFVPCLRKLPGCEPGGGNNSQAVAHNLTAGPGA